MKDENNPTNTATEPQIDPQFGSQISTNSTTQPPQQPQPINSFPQQDSSADTPKSSNHKTPIIIASSIICLGIIGCVAALLISGESPFNPDNQPDSSQANNTSQENASQSTKFEDLTKEEALAFLKSSTGASGILPDGYVEDEILNARIMNGNTIVSDLDLIKSYDNLDELKELARKKYRGLNYLLNGETEETENTEDDFEITEYDYYAIVAPNRIKGTATCDHGYYDDCGSLLSFKKQYFNYTTVENGSPNSTKDAYFINTNLDPEIISQLLRIYTITATYSYNGHGNIYSYDFEELDDKYLLTVNIVGAGINLEMFEDPTSTYGTSSNDASDFIALNLYRRHFAADKADGNVYLVKTDDSTMENVKSIPISQEEFNSLPGYGDQQ